MFENIEKGPADPMYDLKRRADGDLSQNKADLGVGIYRNEDGLYQEFDSVKLAKIALAENDPGHDYEVTTGNAHFLEHAAKLMFGEDSERLQSKQVSSVQTISGTGAVHLAALFLAKAISPLPKVFVGTPAWGNYKPLCTLVGLQAHEYSYYDSSARTIDMRSILSAIHSAPSSSIFILQGCCHNPTGADPSPAQWNEIAAAMREKGHFPLFDTAYQGLGNGLDEDAYAVRLFARMGFEMLVCQSFSKNFALYGERCGALHAVCGTAEAAENVQDQLRCLIRWEFSSAPAFGSRLVGIVLDNDHLDKTWRTELLNIQARLKGLRRQLHEYLSSTFKTPGNWDHIIQETGLFSYLRLSPDQCSVLVNAHHIYLPPNGRINVSGLNQGNIARVARAIDAVSRDTSQRASL